MTPITLDDQIRCIGSTLASMRRQYEWSIAHINFPDDIPLIRANAEREELVLESILNKLQKEKQKNA